MSGWIFVCLTVVGCEGVPTTEGSLVRDSAGVRIVENRSSAWEEGEGRRVSAEPTAVIGALHGPVEQQLTRVRDATVLPDGRIALLNSGAARVQIHGADGEHLRTMGGPGDGPGEFQAPRWLTVRGDSILAFDPRHGAGRLTRYDLSGELVGTDPVRIGVAGVVLPDGVLPDGRLLGESVEGSRAPTDEGHVVFTRHVVAFAAEGGAVDTIAVAGAGEAWRAEWDGRFVQASVPFGRASYSALGHDRLYLGDGHASAVLGYGPRGALELSIGLPRDRRPVTREDLARWIETELSSAAPEGRPDVRARVEGLYEAAPVPDSTPAHAELEVDAAGHLWVQQYTPPWEATNDWWVFASDGRWLDTVSLPAGLHVFEIGEDYVLGVTRDALDVEYVVRYALEGPTP